MAFEFERKEEQRFDAELTVIHMKASALKAFETAPSGVFETEASYVITMKAEYGAAQNIPDAEKYDVVVFDYAENMVATLDKVRSDMRGKPVKIMSQMELMKLTEAGARLAFDQYAQKTYPDGKGAVEKQNPTHAKANGYAFLVNREAIISSEESKKRSGQSRAKLAGEEFTKGHPTADNGYLVFEKENDAFLLRVELK